MREISPYELQGNTFEMLDKDWMLVTAADENGEKVNTMTASWGGLGVLWGKPVAFVFIRPQRYTYEFTEKNDRMTLSFFGGEMREALTLCGRKSGRDCDKIGEAGLTPVTLSDGGVSFEEAHAVLSCRKMYADFIKQDCMLDESIMKTYEKHDFHRVYVCEIEKVLLRD